MDNDCHNDDGTLTSAAELDLFSRVSIIAPIIINLQRMGSNRFQAETTIETTVNYVVAPSHTLTFYMT